ncbi:gliding motility-associated C-terminal domain-containing protein [Belliella sp. R4-6]|uniref:Gliding motility-associated C-terminal domain-containing protein n=1 Tax=Belliella alkalica TaxID=1730871 RepID=A0ABS9VEI0_9BACT|nr:gliding motility-associated C-terminal domain-containing protein [Belliella alkalica]MCH7414846.1 gliding motility-associated C-terminal domain-containing protein [Belliella alkalica]
MKVLKRKFGKCLLTCTIIWFLVGYSYALPSIDVFTHYSEGVFQQTQSQHSQSASFGKIEVDVSGKLALCSHEDKGEIILDVKGGVAPYTFLWNNNATDQNRYNLFAGTYTVFIKDSRGTEHVERIVIQPPFPLIVELDEIKHGSCANNNLGSAKIKVKIGRGDPYRVEWSHGLMDSMEAKDLPGGEYSVTVYDLFNCSKTIYFSIVSEGASIQAVENITHVGCGGESNGSIQLNISGGVEPYTYRWSNGQTTKDISNLAKGEYSVQIHDSKGCTITKNYSVNQSAAPIPLSLDLLEVSHVSCSGLSEGSVEFEINGGLAPFDISWSDGTKGLLKRSGLSAGVYNLVVRDSFGCMISQEVVVREFDALNVQIDNTLEVDCDSGDKKGVAWVNISGGNPPYKIKWNTGEDSREINFFSNTLLSAEIIDANGCKVFSELKVSFPDNKDNAKLDFDFRKLKISSDLDVFTNEPIQFEAFIPDQYVSWKWDFGDGVTSLEKDPIHLFATGGEFEVQLVGYDIFGCSSIERNIIYVKEIIEVLVLPNAFTPNGDGLNDRFVPIMKGISNFEMNIFNHWGEHVYKESGLDLQGWDGFYKGKLLPKGNYIYKITYTTTEGVVVDKTGGVTLIR